ncbi:insecticidal toxin complex protein TccC [Pseudomonas frederiksbergensis]|uniref:Insecticidal toxin complex protein TccC n=1 Tax=Pseudomonas frederiksbergensis TaxID=104087 RepID=A0A1H4V5P1_9PSED|nr:RHS repeat-associated core domain-containing protein [Pseudomonas frederiksbergensis]SEC75744.1 insecticidal toxin complex protein TccC [Pseudomonas frederiksbergensis]
MQASTMGMDHQTPGLSVVDPRGLPIRSVDYWREVEGDPTQARINRTFHDAAGRAVEQWDPRLWALPKEEPLRRANLTTVFSLAGNALFTDSVDAGWQLNLPGLGNEVLQGWDSRGAGREVEYDDLLRPLVVFEQGTTEPRKAVERMTYSGPDDDVWNQCGQLIRHDDPAGTVLFEAFSITGKCVKQVRHFTLAPVAPDWPQLEADRQRLLEPGDGAVSTWSFGPLKDVLEQVDAKGNRQVFSLTLDGRLRETRLQLQGLTTWQTLVKEIQYNAEGQVTHETAGNHVQTTLLYSAEDGLLRERRAQDASARWLQHLIYDYDRTGNVLSIEDKALPVRYFANQRIEPISRFSYDSLYQLIEASGWEAGGPNQGPESVGQADPAAVSNYRQTYSYDESGNLLKLTHVGAKNPGRELKAARYSNRCLPWRNGVPPTEEEIAAAFDAKGNCLELDQGRFLRWDLRNQLQSISPVERESGLNDQESYVYDGGGQRVRKIRSLNTNARTVVAEVRYLPGLELRTDSGTREALQVITAQAGLNSVRVLHWETDPPSGVTNDQYRYSLVDHLNSCTLELADDARIISRETYHPFGTTAWSAGPNDTDGDYKTVRYSGKERDAAGLYYYGFRYYVPWLQRWLNPDPAGDVDGLNFYLMVINNPMTFRDANGLAKTGNYEMEVGLKQRLLLNVAKLKSKISIFDKASGKYKESNDFKVVEVEMESKYLVGGDEVKKNLRDYKDIYSRRLKASPQRKVGGEESNNSLGESVSGYMLRSANDTFVVASNTLNAPNMHPDTVVERRFFAVLKRADKSKLPEQRKIYGLTELSTFTEKGKTEVTVVQTIVHPDTQGAEERPGEKMSNDASMGELPLMRGVGTYLTVQSLVSVSKSMNVTRVITEAINPRSAKIASKFGAKWVKKS